MLLTFKIRDRCKITSGIQDHTNLISLLPRNLLFFLGIKIESLDTDSDDLEKLEDK